MAKTLLFQNLTLGALMGLATGVAGSVLTDPIGAGFQALGFRAPDILYVYTAGICFALGLGFLTYTRISMRMWKIIVSVLLTPGFYYLAVMLTITATDIIKFGPDLLGPGFVGGAAGGAMLALFWALVTWAKNWIVPILQVSLFGGVSGMISLQFIDELPDILGMLILHVPWHMGVMGLLFAGLAARVNLPE